MKPSSDLKKEFKKLVLSLLFIISLVIFLGWLRPPLWADWLILLAIPTAMMLWKRKFNYEIFVKAAIYILLMLVLFRFLAIFGHWGWILGVLIMAGILLIRRRKNIVRAMEKVETSIWGAPLTDFKKRGKKPPKLRFAFK